MIIIKVCCVRISVSLSLLMVFWISSFVFYHHMLFGWLCRPAFGEHLNGNRYGEIYFVCCITRGHRDMYTKRWHAIYLCSSRHDATSLRIRCAAHTLFAFQVWAVDHQIQIEIEICNLGSTSLCLILWFCSKQKKLSLFRLNETQCKVGRQPSLGHAHTLDIRRQSAR